MADDAIPLPAFPQIPADCYPLLEHLRSQPLTFVVDLPPELAGQDVLDLCEYRDLIAFGGRSGGGPPEGVPLVEWYAEDGDLERRLPPRGRLVPGMTAPGTKWTVALTDRGRACLAERSLNRRPLQPSVGGKGKKATVAARMIDLIKDHATHTWTAEQFRVKLGCKSRSTVTNTVAWKQLAVARESARLRQAQRAYKSGLDVKTDKRRRPKRKKRPHTLDD